MHLSCVRDTTTWNGHVVVVKGMAGNGHSYHRYHPINTTTGRSDRHLWDAIEESFTCMYGSTLIFFPTGKLVVTTNKKVSLGRSIRSIVV